MLLSLQDFMADNFYTPSSDNYAAPGPQEDPLCRGLVKSLRSVHVHLYSTQLHCTMLYSIILG